MKRSAQIKRSGIRTGELETDVTEEQFSLIGRIALAYNEAESLVQFIYGASYGVGAKLGDDFISRTNGLDSTVYLAKSAIRQFATHNDKFDDFCLTLDAFLELKKYRDAIVHSRIFHVPAGIGKGSLNRGKRDEVLLTVAALRGTYKRLELLCRELQPLVLIVILLHQIDTVSRFAPEKLELRKKYTEPMLKFGIARHEENLKRRRSLKPLPTFPDLPEDQQGVDIEEVLRELMDKLKQQG